MEKRRKNAEILDRSIAFFYDMIYQINMAIQEQDLNRKSFKFENHFYNRRKHIMKTTVHIISHSHWDREWYQSFEKHRMKLIELVDNILEKAENDPEFGGFFLDGQTIALDDYLEVRPEKREQVEKCVREGKIQTGPWYILQDEFLTSGEACVRNLQVGMQEAARYGAIGNVGYFPDAFGNAGQMPQVLKQAGMDAVVFGRGVKPIGPNNEVTGGQYESTYSEMMWASPDGTKLPGILFANWYNNGVEVPVDEAEAKVYWDKKLTENLLVKLAAVIHDPVTTTDELIPSGETSSYRSNPLRLAEFTLSRREPAYVGRAKEIAKLEGERRSGAVPAEIVETLNRVGNGAELANNTQFGSCVFANKPGDGSAREQAASCQKVLGGFANICYEYATKRYRSNCINWGILPFTIDDGTEFNYEPGDCVFVPGIRAAVENGTENIPAKVIRQNGDVCDIMLHLRGLTPDEKEIILDGCLMNYYAARAE